MQDSRNDSDIDRTNLTNSPAADSTASLYPSDKCSADSIRAILKNSDDRSDNVIRNLFDKDGAFSLTDGKHASQGGFKNLADGIVQVASVDGYSYAVNAGERQDSSGRDGKKPANSADKSTSKPDEKPAENPGVSPQDSPAKPGEKSADKPGEKPKVSPANSGSQPAEGPTSKPGDKPADKVAPGKNPKDSPADKPPEKSKDNSSKPEEKKDDKPKDDQGKLGGKPENKPNDKTANNPDKSNGNPDDKPADKPADKPGQKNSDGKPVERLTLDQGTIKDMAMPEGFKVTDVKPSDDNPPDDNVKTTVLQHQDADKKDAKVAVTKFGYYNQQPETVKAFNEFLDSIKKEDLGKEIELTEKQMDQLYPAIPNGIDARPQSDHKFRVEEIGGKRVLVTESKVSGPDGKPEDERMKTTVYANPDAAKSTIDVISFEASNQDKDKSKPGVSNYSLLKSDVMKAISSITWK